MNGSRRSKYDSYSNRQNQPGRYSRPMITPQRAYVSPEDPSLVSEVVPVPAGVTEWATGSKVQSMFLKVKEASGVSYITSSLDDNGRATILIRAPSDSSANVARMLVEINFKEQIKYQSEMQRLHQMQENLFEVQGEVASGQRIEFQVPMELIGLIIGKKGGRIQEVQQETDVQDIHIDGNTGLVTIVGPSPMAVQRARELVDVVEERVPVDPAAVPSLQRDFSSMNDIKAMSKCLVAKLSPADNQVVLIGPRSAVASAKLVLDTQLEYILKRVQLYESEKSIREQLTSLNKRTGAARGRRDERAHRGPEGGKLSEHAHTVPDDRGRREGGPYRGAARSSAGSGNGRSHGTESLQTVNGDVRKGDRAHTKEVGSDSKTTSAKHEQGAGAPPAAAAQPAIRKKQAGSARTNGKQPPQADGDRLEAAASAEAPKKKQVARATSSAAKDVSTESATVNEVEGTLSEMKLSSPTTTAPSAGRTSGKTGVKPKAKATGAADVAPVEPAVESAPSAGKPRRGKKSAPITALEAPAAVTTSAAPLPPAPSSASDGGVGSKKSSAPKKNARGASATSATVVAPPAPPSPSEAPKEQAKVKNHTASTSNGTASANPVGGVDTNGNKKGQTIREARNAQK